MQLAAAVFSAAKKMLMSQKHREANIHYRRDNVQNGGHYQENESRQNEPDPDAKRRLITRLLAKTKKNP